MRQITRNKDKALAYTIVTEFDGSNDMKRVVGFAIFFVAIGMVISMWLPSTFVEVLVIMICLLLGYNLFCY